MSYADPGKLQELREQLEDARRALAIVDAIRDGIECAASDPWAPAHNPWEHNRSACLRCIADDLCAALSAAPAP